MTAVLMPCGLCGELSTGPRCPDHQPRRDAARTRETYRERGYDGAWDRLSKRARARQNFCTRCQSTKSLSTDHTPEAWHRKANNLPIRLKDVQVLCATCQAILGSSRPGSARYAEWLASRSARDRAETGGVEGDERRFEPLTQATGQSAVGTT